MEIELKHIDYGADLYQVKEVFARILHSDEFRGRSEDGAQLINFQVVLGGSEFQRHNGTGTLIIPSRKMGQLLLTKAANGDVSPVIDSRRSGRSRRILMRESNHRPSKGILETLKKVSYQDPSVDRDRDDKLLELSASLRVDKLQFGVWLQNPPQQLCPGLQLQNSARCRMTFAVEWEKDYTAIGNAQLSLELEHKLIRIQLGDPSLDDEAHSIVIKFSNIQQMWIGIEFRPYICFKVFTPAVLESECFNRILTGVLSQDTRKFRRRVDAIDESHRRSKTCTNDLLGKLWNDITDLAHTHPALAGTILRDYAQSIIADSHNTDHVKRFQNLRDFRLGFTVASILPPTDSLMACHHVTFTPTRMLLEGPYVTQSNRVLRRYAGYHDNFLRVDFRDEDRLQYRWDREVDGTTFLQERVGGILKNGFNLAGKYFEFLAYSSSALREHAVWFVSPFHHPDKRSVNAASIRREEGDFSDNLAYPAKFAARLAQAFTATDPSVKVTREQWCEIADLGQSPYQHTDGVGTISRQLAKLIWEELCRCNAGWVKFAEPSAYQIRFLGYKGVVCIDSQLKGIMMHLRPSMAKFEVKNLDVADIEIAKPFHSPGTFYLNRPLVMLLEDRGANRKAFLNLLDMALADVQMARDNIKHLISVMKRHGLGATFGLPALLQKLSDSNSYGLNLDRQASAGSLRSPFIDELVYCTVSSVLRDIKYRCRIPVPKSWTLVGVADEGPSYIEQGLFREEDVFILQEGEIYACIQLDAESEPVFLQRNCNISRSPTIHPGDVQRVFAIGKPPADKICAFRDLVNVVVFPSRGKRSLASCLSGGDLDGDIYDICQYHPLFLNRHEEPAKFLTVPKWEIDVDTLKNRRTGKIDQEKVIPYVCDFIVEYINSDVLAKPEGVCDKGCIQLAELCNQAVDYPKNGMPVDISNIPRRLIPYKPDWKRGEELNARETDFYRSERALGYLYRAVEIEARPSPMPGSDKPMPLAEHPIYNALRPVVDAKLKDTSMPETKVEEVQKLFRRYSEELRYICTTHALTDHSTQLSEAEIVIGTVLAQCSQHRWRQERIYRMRLHSSNLIKEIKDEILPKKLHAMSISETEKSLEYAWTAWKLIIERIASLKANGNVFGLNSFGLLVLNVVFDCLEHIDFVRGYE
ncbi:hypothetical protein EW145_g298 [Phellinidium pouzarii]|uniref:RNA-dependent RNA polymerase n=1 Tax=Phellinidium pouzarii TaxID=167371 RepID=A0A4S4LJ55_9AGAM|nr:hypothetical protein EW145_g298 [Phellinidium pouzarii]